MSAPLENLETQLEMFIENVRQIRIIVSDFQPQVRERLQTTVYHIPLKSTIFIFVL